MFYYLVIVTVLWIVIRESIHYRKKLILFFRFIHNRGKVFTMLTPSLCNSLTGPQCFFCDNLGPNQVYKLKKQIKEVKRTLKEKRQKVKIRLWKEISVITSF